MQYFRIFLETGLFIVRGDATHRRPCNTDYVFGAEDLAQASVLARRHVGDRASQRPPASHTSIVEDISDWLDPHTPSDNVRKVLRAIENSARLMETITVKAVVIECPDDETNTLIVHLREGDNRKRVVVEPLDAFAEGPQWLEERVALTPRSFVRTAQSLF
ncbi:hypothetical protein [Rhizobium sp. Leaf371]|uniref:hypothetical protein n=1 Tax=Rhizobium sp. Leaf371 TaxID=1736355 RepID=UPI0012E8635F|nr:hypothetical protein [Rhizobium sp. Leaf371]